MYMKNGKKKPERKYIKISGKRQITIPKKFYYELGFEDQAECILNDGALTIKPVRENIGFDFSQEILEDLIAEGFSGDEMLLEFKKRKLEIRKAWESMLKVADDIAEGKGEYYTLDEVFPEE